MSYVCLNCSNEYDVGYLKSEKVGFICPNKNCKSKLYEVDNMLLPIVSLLHKKGFDIISCNNSSLTNENVQDVKTSLELSRYVKGLYLNTKHIEELVEYIDKYAEIMYNDDKIVIIFDNRDLSLREAYYQIVENCLVLLDWCKKVIEPLCKELDSSWCEGEEVSEDIDRSENIEEIKEYYNGFID